MGMHQQQNGSAHNGLAILVSRNSVDNKAKQDPQEDVHVPRAKAEKAMRDAALRRWAISVPALLPRELTRHVDTLSSRASMRSRLP
jgi:hypothetical protein